MVKQHWIDIWEPICEAFIMASQSAEARLWNAVTTNRSMSGTVLTRWYIFVALLQSEHQAELGSL